MSEKQRHSQQVRDTAMRLMDRLQTDQDFAKKIKADPAGALTGEGLPSEAVGDFMHTANIPTEGEVSGFMMCSETCLDTESARCRINTAKYPY